MKKLLHKINQKLLKHKKHTVLVAIFVVIFVVFIGFLIRDGTTPLRPPVIVNTTVPPVIIDTPELILAGIVPQSGPRVTVDAFSQTFFEFTADLDEASARVSVSPYISTKSRVYQGAPKTLVIEPSNTPWVDGVEYTITVSELKGVAGEVLRNPVIYKFSIQQLTEVEGGDPIR